MEEESESEGGVDCCETVSSGHDTANAPVNSLPLQREDRHGTAWQAPPHPEGVFTVMVAEGKGIAVSVEQPWLSAHAALVKFSLMHVCLNSVGHMHTKPMKVERGTIKKKKGFRAEVWELERVTQIRRTKIHCVHV